MAINPEILRRFTYVPPDEAAKEKHAQIRNAAITFASIIDETVPDGREKAEALTNVQNALMYANAAIATCKPTPAGEQRGPSFPELVAFVEDLGQRVSGLEDMALSFAEESDEEGAEPADGEIVIPVLTSES